MIANVYPRQPLCGRSGCRSEPDRNLVYCWNGAPDATGSDELLIVPSCRAHADELSAFMLKSGASKVRHQMYQVKAAP